MLLNLRVKYDDLREWLFSFFLFLLPFQISVLVFTSDNFNVFFNPFVSHFLFLKELCFLVLIVLFLPEISWQKIVARFQQSQVFKWMSLFLFFCFFSIFFAGDLMVAFLKFVHLFQGYLLFILIQLKLVDLKKAVRFLYFSMILVGGVSLFQFFSGHSVGLHFLGESVLSANQLGVAKVSFEGGNFLRAYGFSAHPNIFAALLLYSLFFVFYYRASLKPFLFCGLFLFFSVALFLTFSRSAILVYLLVLLLASFKRFSLKKILFALLLFAAMLVFLDIMFFRLFADYSGFSERLLYLGISIKMLFLKFWGVGLGHFTQEMPYFSHLKLFPWLIQPVHNLFLLIANETGVQGGIAFLWTIFALFKSNVNKPILIGFTVLAMFDHYFFTSYQGQIMLFSFIAFLDIENTH